MCEFFVLAYGETKSLNKKHQLPIPSHILHHHPSPPPEELLCNIIKKKKNPTNFIVVFKDAAVSPPHVKFHTVKLTQPISVTKKRKGVCQ